MQAACDELDDWVAEAVAGSGVAFTRLWELLAPVVAGYVRGRGAQEVDDVTSEVFLAAFRNLEGFAGDGAAFRRWLFTIAHRRAVDAVRRQIRAGTEDAYEAEADPRSTRSAEVEALGRLEHDATLRLIHALPEDQRDVLLLRLVAGLPVEEVAVVLGRSGEAVRQLQRRAIVRVRSLAGTATGQAAEAVPAGRRG